MKLNDSSPQQHLAILVLAGLFVFLNVIEGIKDKAKHDERVNGPTQKYADSFDPLTNSLIARETHYENPKLSWYELIFCRGFKRSSACSYKMKHPFTDEIDASGIAVPDGEPKKDYVMSYRGSISRSASGKVVAPEEKAPPPQLEE